MSRLIVITGVSRGLGRALVREFAERGHTVFGCARSATHLRELQREFGGGHQFDAVDVALDEAVFHWASRLVDRHGAPDLLINNAALINPTAPLWRVPADEFGAVIDVNIKGVANTIRHFLPPMILKGRGVIVNLSSGWGRSVNAQVAPYCATKWAIEGLTRALAEELPEGMCAVPLNPGIINTDMLRRCFGAAAGDFENPETWARRAAPFILQIGPKDNGRPLSVPS